MLARVDSDGTHVMRVGGWTPEFGIVLVADLFAVLVRPLPSPSLSWSRSSASVSAAPGWGANPELDGPPSRRPHLGCSLSILTGDLFTLFVAFEMILVSSYVLLTHQGQRGQIQRA